MSSVFERTSGRGIRATACRRLARGEAGSPPGLQWLWLIAAACATVAAAVVPKPRPETRVAVPPAPRPAWTRSAVVGTPDPPPPFRTQRAFPRLAFEQPTALAASPAGDRWFVTQMNGKVYSFPDDRDCPEPELLIDVDDVVARLGRSKGEELAVGAVYGIVPDPDYAANRFIYLCYSACYKDWNRMPPLADGTRVVRLTASQEDPPRCDPESEIELIAWPAGGHHCGCLAFGPDGCLYVSTGDGGFHEPADGLRTGQDVTDLLASILRIDVHDCGAGRPYAIPLNNPLLDVPGARGEIFAFGLRNPWKMSFDRKTGDLWVGDVGLERTEWIRRVRAGDNCGWSLVDGSEPLHTDWPRGPGEIVPPAVEIPHTDASSITGGFVYRGQRFPELVGRYVFGDWETRRLWSMDVTSDPPGQRQDLADPRVRVVAFAEDRDGELLLLDHGDGTIHELARNEAAETAAPFPMRLSQTGLFRDTAAHEPAAGVVPFEVVAEAWADHATARRLIAVPGDAAVTLHSEPKVASGSMFPRQLEFPAGTVLAKTFAVELIAGDPRSSRRIETQLLHHDGLTWRGYTYAWSDDQADAELVAAAGTSRELSIVDREAPGGRRRQTWRFSSRSECLRCHNPWAETALAFNVAQLDRDLPEAQTTSGQLEHFRRIGLLADAPADGPEPAKAPASAPPLPRLAALQDASAPLEDRARAYLHVNCGHCHRFGGGGMAAIHLNREVPLADSRALDVAPGQGGFGISDPRIIAAGDPARSTLVYRLASAGAGHMPPIGTSLVDHGGVTLIFDWIRTLEATAGGGSGPDAAALTTDATTRAAAIQQLLASIPGAVELAQAVRERRLPAATRAAVLAAAADHPESAVTALFEPFLAPGSVGPRLGTAIDPRTILSLDGDPARGRSLYLGSASLQCRSCHLPEASSRAIGPPLADVGRRLDRRQILEAILEPSKLIAPDYRTWVVQTADGRLLTGLVVSRSADGLVLRDAAGQDSPLATADIEAAVPQSVSLMPEHTLRDLSPQQAADLLAYLAGCLAPDR
jgi:uncharacterized repeat protein (TIGR03806 family)